MRYLLTICAFAVSAFLMPAMAQEQPDYKAFRTNTWSIYAQGGASWANSTDMQNVNASASTLTNPLIGAGLNYNVKPWLRLGLNYEFSTYVREQRFSEFQPITGVSLEKDGMTLVENGGGKAYGKMWTQFHAADFSVEFNLAELCPNRKAQWFSMYLGTGVGYLIANGNMYEISMGYEVWKNTYNVESNSWLKAHNARHEFSSPYIPATLSVEFDVTPRFTIGAKCGIMYLLTSADFAPKFMETAGLVLRLNLIGKKQGYHTYKARYGKLSGDYNALARSYDDAAAKDARELQAAAAREKALQDKVAALEAANAALAEANEECAASRKLVVMDHVVMFDLDSAEISDEQKEALLDYIHMVLRDAQDASFTICGEASTEGSVAHNRSLSDRRLQSVVRVLNSEGIGYDRIINTKAIGEDRGIDGPQGRRVVIDMYRR